MVDDRDPYDDGEERDLGPGDADYDLSEEHGYMWEPKRAHWPVPPGLLLAISVLVVVAEGR